MRDFGASGEVKPVKSNCKFCTFLYEGVIIFVARGNTSGMNAGKLPKLQNSGIHLPGKGVRTIFSNGNNELAILLQI